MALRKVLSIDGGGIRGIIPAVVLARIEAETNKPICELFDLIAGTSTGGIIALGLTTPGENNAPKYSAADLVDLYLQKGKEIFPKPSLIKMRFVRNLFGPKYSPRGLERVLHRYFDDVRLGEALTPVMVTGYNIDRSTSWFFKSHRVKKYPERNSLMREVARATSAAPTYFPPGLVNPPSSEEDDFHPIIDGGVFANNPAMCAYVEAVTSKELGEPLPKKEDILVVSLGTGESPHLVRYNKARRWGLLQWAPPMLGVVFDGVSDTVDYQLECLLGGNVGNYYRFQPILEGSALDDARSETLRLLKAAGEEITVKYRQRIEDLCEKLLGKRETQRSSATPDGRLSD